MYAACPSCKALYQLEPVHLRAANGRVRCGQCQQVFNAAAGAFETAQQALDFAEHHHQAVEREIDDLVDRALGEVPGAEVAPATGEAAEPAAESAAEPAPGAPAEPLVEEAESIDDSRACEALRADADYFAQPVSGEFTRHPPRPEAPAEAADAHDESHLAFLLDWHSTAEHRTAWGMIAIAVALTLVLVGQYLWAERYELANSATMRPFMEVFCKQLECDLPLRRDLNKVEMVEYEVRDHPHVDDALLINATLVNRAEFIQAYPAFQVSFSDLSGTPVSMRRFLPTEYVGDQRVLDRGLAPGQQAHVLLEVVDPGDRAVSFQFYFF